MSDLNELRSMENLQRAWRWVQSNADANFKSYFRELYRNYAVAEDALLANLSDQLRRGIYQPKSSCKLFHPKASGILRPYSLLTVDDQIVYQAAVNLIAERLFPRVNHRCYKQVFGHLYAGRTSIWFYRKWSDGYRAFNDAARKAFGDGFIFTASFDLTACYDSLDHNVLRYFLKKLGFDLEFQQKFTEWLGKWTATHRGIYHNHGIPQGPVSSGLVSEVALFHFDELRVRGVNFRYFRYVDDIRLFAKNEADLRRLLVELDLLSKDIGLFPQSSKIKIRQIRDIEDELKSVSNPPEAAIKRPFVDQKRLLSRIVELTPRYRISNDTRFKYLLAHAIPSAPLTARLWRILEKHPEIYRNACNYLRRYIKLPRVTASKVVEWIKTNTLYQSVRGEFISVADGRLSKIEDAALGKFLRRGWTPRSLQPDLLARMGHFLIRTGHLNPRQVLYACAHARSWWTRAILIEQLDMSSVSSTTLQNVVDVVIRDQGEDAARAAAWKAFLIGHVPFGQRNQWNPSGEILLREVGMVQRALAGCCGITSSFTKLDAKIPILNWRRLFGNRYAQAERQAVETVAATGVNITGFVNLLDVFNDLLLAAVFNADGTIGGYNLGSIGSALSPTSRFAKKFPATFTLASVVHDIRYGSMYSHPLVRNTGKPTGKISYKFLPKAKRLMRSSFAELSTHGLA
jgi:hypothetical protein